MNEHAPGWYEHDGERRYWDGTQWTHATTTPPAGFPPPAPAPAPAPAYPPPAYAPPPQQLVPYGVTGAPFAPPVPRKDPAIALLVSFLVPGVGSMMNGDVGPGIGILMLYIFSIVFFVCFGWALIGFLGLPLMLLAWGWGMWHAYQGAVEANRRAGYAG
jgi:TM2 domain-containing membrane protein YozV